MLLDFPDMVRTVYFFSQLVQRHNLLKRALSDILHVVSELLPEQPTALQSLYKFQQALCSVGLNRIDVIAHTLCPSCQCQLSAEESLCGTVGCPYDGKEKPLSFMELPIDKQLQSMFSS